MVSCATVLQSSVPQVTMPNLKKQWDSVTSTQWPSQPNSSEYNYPTWPEGFSSSTGPFIMAMALKRYSMTIQTYCTSVCTDMTMEISTLVLDHLSNVAVDQAWDLTSTFPGPGIWIPRWAMRNIWPHSERL